MTLARRFDTQRLLPPELEELGPGELLVNEFFYSIQGESTHAGRPCFFIRLAGCHLRCSYCDTAYAFFEGRRVSVAECVEEATRIGCNLVEVTGGEPLLQRATPEILATLCDKGFEVLLETGGAIDPSHIDRRVKKIVDLKTPSSGMSNQNVPDLAPKLGPGDELKFVIGDRADFDWARRWLGTRREDLSSEIPIHFSPVHDRLSPQELSKWVLEERLAVRVNLQLHKFIWPDVSRGV